MNRSLRTCRRVAPASTNSARTQMKTSSGQINKPNRLPEAEIAQHSCDPRTGCVDDVLAVSKVTAATREESSLEICLTKPLLCFDPASAVAGLPGRGRYLPIVGRGDGPCRYLHGQRVANRVAAALMSILLACRATRLPSNTSSRVQTVSTSVLQLTGCLWRSWQCRQ